MADNTKISYLDATWNPVRMRCTPVSAGCANCWHLATDKRFMKHVGKPVLDADVLGQPLHWSKKPRRIGVQFMGDIFHSDVPDKFILKVIDIIRWCSTEYPHQFLLLSKRPERAVELFPRVRFDDAGSGRMYLSNHPYKYPLDGYPLMGYNGASPLRNLWIGTSVEDQRTADQRIPKLLQISARMRWLSIEPCLENISIPIGKYDWVVIGCESGRKRRPCKTEWIESIVDQCTGAGVPVYVKQVDLGGRVSHNPEEWPGHLKKREFPL